MSDSIQQAADAFARDMNGGAAPRPAPGIAESKGKPEVLFEEAGFLENPDEPAGGDTQPPPKVEKKAKQPQEEILEDGDGDTDDVEPSEGEEEDDEGSEDNEESDDGDDEGDEEGDDELLKREFEVMVDGEPVTVPLQEALNGYIRQKTFDQRMNKAAEVTRAVEQRFEEVQQATQVVIDMYAEAAEVVKAIQPQEPDWDKLFSENPQQARIIQKNFQEFQAKVAEVQKKHSEAIQKVQQEEARRTAEFARTEAPKFASLAKWRTPEERGKDIASMRKTALAVGLSEKEVSNIFDSRYLHILLKASKYDRMMAAKPKPVSKTIKPVSPGAGRTNRTAPKGISKAQRQLSRSGSIHDAAPVFAEILSRSK